MQAHHGVLCTGDNNCEKSFVDVEAHCQRVDIGACRYSVDHSVNGCFKGDTAPLKLELITSSCKYSSNTVDNPAFVCDKDGYNVLLFSL